jgi:hypothetical protein
MVDERSNFGDDPLDALLGAGGPIGEDASECIADPPFDPAVLVRYQRGELAGDAAVSPVESHVAECARCRDFLVEHAHLVAEQRVVRLRRGIVASVVAVAAVLLMALVFRGSGSSEPPGPYRIGFVRGVDQELRGTVTSTPATKDEPWTVHADSDLVVLLEPTEKNAISQAELGVFVTAENDRLSRVPDSLWKKSVDRGFTVFELRASGRELFGAHPGKRSLVFALASTAGAMKKVESETLATAMKRTDIRWIIQRIEYADRGN